MAKKNSFNAARNLGSIVNPKPTTARGRHRSAESDEYEQNLEARKSQSHPAAPSRGVAKGPTSWPSGFPQGEDKKKYLWDFGGRIQKGGDTLVGMTS